MRRRLSRGPAQSCTLREGTAQYSRHPWLRPYPAPPCTPPPGHLPPCCARDTLPPHVSSGLRSSLWSPGPWPLGVLVAPPRPVLTPAPPPPSALALQSLGRRRAQGSLCCSLARRPPPGSPFTRWPPLRPAPPHARSGCAPHAAPRAPGAPNGLHAPQPRRSPAPRTSSAFPQLLPAPPPRPASHTSSEVRQPRRPVSAATRLPPRPRSLRPPPALRGPLPGPAPPPEPQPPAPPALPEPLPGDHASAPAAYAAYLSRSGSLCPGPRPLPRSRPRPQLPIPGAQPPRWAARGPRLAAALRKPGPAPSALGFGPHPSARRRPPPAAQRRGPGSGSREGAAAPVPARAPVPPRAPVPAERRRLRRRLDADVPPLTLQPQSQCLPGPQGRARGQRAARAEAALETSQPACLGT